MQARTFARDPLAVCGSLTWERSVDLTQMKTCNKTSKHSTGQKLLQQESENLVSIRYLIDQFSCLIKSYVGRLQK